MSDLISRQAAIDRIQGTGYADAIKNNLMLILRLLPSAQPETHDKRTETHSCDCISRQAAIKALDDILYVFRGLELSCVHDMPSFRYNNKKDYKIIPTKYHKGYQQALGDAEKEIKKILEELCYG